MIGHLHLFTILFAAFILRYALCQSVCEDDKAKMSRIIGLETYKNNGVKCITTMFANRLYRSNRFPIASPIEGFRFMFQISHIAFTPGLLCFLTFEFSNGKTTSEQYTLRIEGEERTNGEKWVVAYFLNEYKVAECKDEDPQCTALLFKYHGDGRIMGEKPGGHVEHHFPKLSEAETFQQFHKIMWIKIFATMRNKYHIQFANDVYLLDYPPPTTTTEAPPPTTTRRTTTTVEPTTPKTSAFDEWGVYVLIAALLFIACVMIIGITVVIIRFMLKQKKKPGPPGAPAPVKTSASAAPSASKTASRQPIAKNKTEDLLPPSSSAAPSPASLRTNPSPASLRAKPEGSTVDEYVAF